MAPGVRPAAAPRAIIEGAGTDFAPACNYLEPGMSIVVRDVHAHELDSILALNNAAGAGILLATLVSPDTTEAG